MPLNKETKNQGQMKMQFLARSALLDLQDSMMSDLSSYKTKQGTKRKVQEKSQFVRDQ